MNPWERFEKTMPLSLVSFCFLAGCAGGLQETSKAHAQIRPDEIPTVEAAHERSGPALPSLAPSAAPQHLTYRVCIEVGKTRAMDVQPVFGAEPADAVLVPVLRESEWKIAPDAQKQHAADGALCFLDSMESGADGALRPAAQPFLTTTAERVAQPGDASPQLPESVQQRFVGKSIIGMYRMCLTAGSGAVSSVQPVVGIPGADAVVTIALRSWKYKPITAETCWVEPLMFTLASGPAAPTQRDDGNSDYNRNVSKMPRNAFQ